MESEFFSLEEVERSLPEVSLLIEEAVAVQIELKHAYAQALIGSESESEEKLITKDVPDKNRKRIRMLTEELNDILEELEDIGVIIRDLDEGAVDFPGFFQGKEIFFSWKLGDEQINHWYAADEDFEDRHKIIRLG